MDQWIKPLIGIGSICLFIWIFFVKSNKPTTAQESLETEQAQVIGLITGMMGGSISDAATARYALQRFETQHQRKATSRDIAIVMGMIRGMK
jgi:nitrate reductase gamma subunit